MTLEILTVWPSVLCFMDTRDTWIAPEMLGIFRQKNAIFPPSLSVISRTPNIKTITHDWNFQIFSISIPGRGLCEFEIEDALKILAIPERTHNVQKRLYSEVWKKQKKHSFQPFFGRKMFWPLVWHTWSSSLASLGIDSTFNRLIEQGKEQLLTNKQIQNWIVWFINYVQLSVWHV